MTSKQLADMLFACKYAFHDEVSLQDAVQRVLESKGVVFEREVMLTPRDRIDFLAGTVGIEIKIQSPVATVERQLFRYSEHDCISELILVTSKNAHRRVPQTLRGKPVTVVYLANSIF